MQFTSVAQPNKRKHADLLVLPFWKEKSKVEWAADEGFSSPELNLALESGDFTGKEGEMLFLYWNEKSEKRVVLLGLGLREKASLETFRRVYGALTKVCLSKKLKELNLVLPKQVPISDDQLIQGITEGLLLPNYVFDQLKQSETEEKSLLQKINFIGSHKNALAIAEKVLAICQAVYFARDLINGNADDVTPQYLVSCAKELAKQYKAIKTTVFDKKRLVKEGFGLLLAVNRGSQRDPAFVIMEYKGNAHSKDHTVMVGKGITYDTGGLNIKVAGMELMKCDMSGAAACLGTILAVCLLKLKVNLTVVFATTENCVDANSFKPGDVYRGYSGKSVEMMNSDAEGRLILADSLAYACKNLKPSRLIDFATLTGAIDIALGPEATGMMCNQDELANALLKAGEATAERVWRMPLFEEYRERLKSDIADIKSWNGRTAGACVAASFLQAFVDKDIPWAHLDIASTAYLGEVKKYLPKYGTGVGIRLMIELLENHLTPQK